MFINSWPSRALLMIALQRAAWRRVKDSPLEHREAELLAATDRAALLTTHQMAEWAGEAKIKHLLDVVESLQLTI